MLVTFAVFHDVIVPLNTVAPLNIFCICITSAVFHELIFWLKAIAVSNIKLILLTLAVFQVDISWLKTDAPLNIFDIDVTSEVFHLLASVLISWLNTGASLNILDIEVTLDVSQAVISALNVATPSPWTLLLNKSSILSISDTSQLVILPHRVNGVFPLTDVLLTHSLAASLIWSCLIRFVVNVV